jgi:hypothetical protein
MSTTALRAASSQHHRQLLLALTITSARTSKNGSSVHHVKQTQSTLALHKHTRLAVRHFENAPDDGLRADGMQV